MTHLVLPLRPGPERAQEASRFRGCLLGGAVGDALGAPVELDSLTAIERSFGPGGIRDYAPAYGRLGAITDDTQLTLFTAEGLLRAFVRASMRGIGPVFESVTAHAYLRWLQSQGERHRLLFGEPGLLLGLQAMHSRRAPGNTCLAALRAMKQLGTPTENQSKGCGGVMRVAPVALFVRAAWPGRPDERARFAFQLGANLAGITHGHATGKLASGALAAILIGILDGVDLASAINSAMDLLAQSDGGDETLAAMTSARRLAGDGVSAHSAIAYLGGGWVAEEALAIGLYCAITARDFEEGAIAAVNHGGDSDSTGAIAGNLLGALHGEESIPDRWLAGLELRDVIASVAEDLLMCPEWGVSEYDEGPVTPFYWERYPGC